MQHLTSSLPFSDRSTRAITSLWLAALCVGLSAASGCGTRTPLTIGMDGSVPPGRDAGLFDASITRPDAVVIACRSDGECDDGLRCNGVEACIEGVCRSLMPPICDDGVDCTRDGCTEASGCVSVPDDSRCPGGTCGAGGCVSRRCMTDGDCSDGLACNGIERCDPGTLTCVSTMAPACDDGIDCTRDSCTEPAGACAHVPDDAFCPDDGSRCDPMAGCVGGVCRRDADCDDGRFCNGAETCGPEGRCLPGPAIGCADMIDCTVDTCSESVRGCVSTPDSSRCPMGLLCDVAAGGCSARRCRSAAECQDGAFCNGAERCVAGRCLGGTAPSCDDGESCTLDTCESGLDMCVSRPRSTTETCDNGLDDDCDGRVDCDDTECRATPDCSMCMPIAAREIFCADMRDYDCDMRFDCDDPDCAMSAECRPAVEICNNGRDDDGDGRIDCADPDCRLSSFCRDAGPTPRDAGTPRDTGPPRDAGRVTAEIGIAACTNGIDDDRDGRTDCMDPDCSPFGSMGECCNGRDDDGDGQVDVFTCRCFDDATCVGVGDLEQVCWESSFSVCAPRCNFYGGNSFCRMLFPGALERCDAVTGECVP